MEILPQRFKTLEAYTLGADGETLSYGNSSPKGKEFHYSYITASNQKGEHLFFKGINEKESEDFYVEWISQEKPLCSYRLVRFTDGMYGYRKVVDEESEEIMPYKFDIASEFNEYGYAMVGKNGFVNWINRDFEYVTLGGTKRKLSNTAVEDLLEGGEWQGISEFSKGKNPLSAMYSYQARHEGTLMYLNTRGQRQIFKEYDGQITAREKPVFWTNDFYQGSWSFFNINDVQFDEQDIKILPTMVLFSRGYYSSLKSVLKIASKSGVDVVETINEETKRIAFKSNDCSKN